MKCLRELVLVFSYFLRIKLIMLKVSLGVRALVKVKLW